jgi:iron(III) transport system substrate-binding protein
MNRITRNAFVVSLLCAFLFPLPSSATEWQTDWEKTLVAAKKEGTVVVGIPASSELRTAISTKFKEKFGIPVELMSARGPQNVTRIITEFNAGFRYFYLLVSGGATPLSMVAAGAADDFQSYMILPEVKDPKNWWGGHIWEDNVGGKRQVYAFLCYTSETLWFNGSQVEPSEIRSFDDLLNPKWKGKIGFLDPRNPGSGQNTWSCVWKV